LQGILGLGPLPEQCGTVRDSGHRPARERRRAPWSSASFLAYLGGITILVAVGSLLEVQSGEHGAGGFVGWAALIFVVLTTLAVLAGWSGHRVTSGLFALTSVLAFVTALGALLDWFSWLDTDLDSPFGGTRASWLVLELLLIVAAAVALRGGAARPLSSSPLEFPA
jgi:hypothetical protein